MDTFSGHTLCNSCTSGTNTLLANFLCRDFGGWENDGIAISQLASHQCGTRLDTMCQVHQLNGRVELKIRLNSHRRQHYTDSRDLVHISISYTLIDLPRTICLALKKMLAEGFDEISWIVVSSFRDLQQLEVLEIFVSLVHCWESLMCIIKQPSMNPTFISDI